MTRPVTGVCDWCLQKHGSFLYIFAIAALPAQQGKGLGSILMRFITARADELGLASYLEVQCIFVLQYYVSET